MKKEELIRALNKFPPDTDVVLLYDENGWYDIDSISIKKDGDLEMISLNSEDAP